MFILTILFWFKFLSDSFVSLPKQQKSLLIKNVISDDTKI